MSDDSPMFTACGKEGEEEGEGGGRGEGRRDTSSSITDVYTAFKAKDS